MLEMTVLRNEFEVMRAKIPLFFYPFAELCGRLTAKQSHWKGGGGDRARRKCLEAGAASEYLAKHGETPTNCFSTVAHVAAQVAPKSLS